MNFNNIKKGEYQLIIINESSHLLCTHCDLIDLCNSDYIDRLDISDVFYMNLYNLTQKCKFTPGGSIKLIK